jgi:Skp family chaperone for outer membrane proteins
VSVYPDAVSANQAIKTITNKSNETLAATGKELDDLVKEYNAAKAGMTKKQRKEKEYTIRKKKEDFEALHNKLSTEVKTLEGQAGRQVLINLKGLIAEAAKDAGVDVVMEDSQVLYGKNLVDLTDRVIKRFPKQKSEK